MPALGLCTANTLVEMSVDGTTWTDITDFVGRIDPQAREVPRQTYKTFGGPVYCTGIADPTDVELEILVTEADTDPYTVLREKHFDGTLIGLRWQPNTGASAKRWTVINARIPSWDDPEIVAESDTLPIALATLNVDQVNWELAV